MNCCDIVSTNGNMVLWSHAIYFGIDNNNKMLQFKFNLFKQEFKTRQY